MMVAAATQVHLRTRAGWGLELAPQPPTAAAAEAVRRLRQLDPGQARGKARGFDEALFTDRGGLVVECTGANVFMVKDGRVTAVAHDDALDGITRDTLLRLSGAQARPVPLAELLEADEVFACGTAAEVAPVAQIEDRRYGDNPVTRELAELYGRVVRGREHAWRHWLTEV